jgi:hypothetical protein
MQHSMRCPTEARPRTSARALSVLVAIAAAACSDSATAPGAENVSISMATVTTPAAVARPDLAPPITGNGHSLTLSGLTLTLGDLRLEHSGHTGADDHGVGNDDVLFAAGLSPVTLPVDGGVVTLAAREVPSGTYSQVEAELVSLRVTGSYDGAAIDATVELSHDMELALNPPITTRSGAASNATVTIEFSSCFTDASGTPVDPRTLQSGGNPARDTFRECVASKLRAFEDRNRDGHDTGDDHGSN